MDALIERLKDFEGYRKYAYHCTEGKLTIGYGTMIEPPGQGVSKEIAEALLEEKVYELSDVLTRYEWYNLLDNPRKECIIEMCYQLGVTGVLQFKKMIAALSEQDWDGAYRQALDSRWAEQTPERAKNVATRLRDGSYGA